MLDAAGRPDDAASALEQALRAAPQREDLYRQAAAYLTRSGKAPEALRLLGQADQTLPKNREVLLAKATTFEIAGQASDAQRALDEIQKLWPEWPAAWVARGVILANQKNFEAAREALENAVALGAHSPETRFYLADCELRAKRAAAAEAAIQPALDLAPDDPWVQELGGRIAMEKRDYATAVKRLSEAVRLRPNFGQAHIGLAQAYTALGRKQEAQSQQELLKTLPDAGDDPPYLKRLFQDKASQNW
jgi:predicted Zn-dependent protease